MPAVLSELGAIATEAREELTEGMRRLVALGQLPPTPELARQRIETRFDCELRSTGVGCEGIESLRSLIAETDGGLGRALTITAPHTHWPIGDFVVEQHSDEYDEYHIGPSQALPQTVRWPIWPISFLFAPGGPIAYEWADQSVGLDAHDLPRLWNQLRELNDATCSRWGSDLPLGVAVNHRFKDLWGRSTSPTSEEPADASDEVYAVVRRVAAASPPVAGSVQVGWDARRHVPVSPEDRDLIRRLEEIAEQMAPSQAEKLLGALHDHLREHLSSDTDPPHEVPGATDQ